jgi:hypothetical protein
MTEMAAEFEHEHDPYIELLGQIGRTEELDQRVVLHELGHLLIDRISGHNSITFISVTPCDGYEGICRGTLREAFVSNGATGIDASAVRAILAPSMPTAGEDRSDKADVYASVLDACTQLMAGEAAEKMLLGEASFAADDRKQAGELAALICRTPQAIERFVQFCSQQATDMLSEHVLALMSLSIVLKIRRTMTGAAEIDQAIAVALAGEAAALERIRRRQWRQRVESAAKFKPEQTVEMAAGA